MEEELLETGDRLCRTAAAAHLLCIFVKALGRDPVPFLDEAGVTMKDLFDWRG